MPHDASHQVIYPSILYFGTPVVLISTCNPDGSANLAPMSSAWALDQQVVLGLGAQGQTARNLARTRECVLNIPSPEHWEAVERLAPLTGRDPVPEDEAGQFRFEADKFGAAELTPVASHCVAPPRARECKLQLEARVRAQHPLAGADALIFVVEVVRVHAHPSLIVDERHISPARWTPLIYSFRHYFGLSPELGKTFRAEI
jgi:flavin reductase (DIM6/NTAB) family NADH-FMN oxidoreductase RutF